MKKFFFTIVIIYSFSSCTIYRTISFNADHSGSMETKIDMTDLVSMYGEENGGMGNGGMGKMSDLESIDKSKAALESISGISNVKVYYDTTGIMYSSYDFNSTEALMNAMNSGGSSNSMMMGMGGTGEGGPKPRMIYKGKKFFFEEIDK